MKKFTKRTLSVVILLLVFAFSLVCALPFGTTAVYAVDSYTVEDYYEENKTVVENIDAGGEYFTRLKDAAKATGDDETFKSMQTEVKTAKALANVLGKYPLAAYLKADADKMANRIAVVVNAVSPKADDYLSFFRKESKNLTRIDELDAELYSYVAKAERFAEAKDAALKKLLDRKTLLLSKTGEANVVVGALDATAKLELEEVYSDYVAEVSAVSYSTDLTDREQDDKNYYAAIKDLTQKADNGEAAMGGGGNDGYGVAKNAVERTKRLYNRYARDYEDGAEPTGAELAEKERRKAELAQAIRELDECFWNNASSEILKEYSYEKNVFSKFVSDPAGELGSFEPTSELSTENGAFKITVLVKGTDEKVAVIPAGAEIKAYGVDSSAKRANAAKALRKQNSALDVAYSIEIKLYDGVKEYEYPATDASGRELVYRVEVDLEKYYSEYIEGKDGFFGGLLEQIGINTFKSKNKTADITACEKEILSDANKGVSLVYSYGKGEDGKTALTPLTYEIREGNILMFETSGFNMFAVAQQYDGSLLSNPLFYIIAVLALILVIAFVVIIVKNVKYTVKFYTDGGNKIKPIKAKKGESFVMPANPVKQGFAFAGWYEDKELKRRFIDTKIARRKGLKVYAKWIAALAPEKIGVYFEGLRSAMLLRGEFVDDNKLAEGESRKLGVLSASDTDIKVYLALDAKEAAEQGYEVKTVKAKEYADTPTLFVVDSKEAYLKAVELIDLMAKENELKTLTEKAPVATDGDQKYFTFVIAKPQKAEEEVPACEETIEEVAEEVEAEEVAEVVETTEETELTETVEEVEEEFVPTEADLKAYLAAARKTTMGYALAEENDKVKNGMMLVKACLKETFVAVYLALDPEKFGFEKAEGAFAEETPSLVTVANPEELNKALDAIKLVMNEYGLEETGEECELAENEAKGFGYRLTYND